MHMQRHLCFMALAIFLLMPCAGTIYAQDLADEETALRTVLLADAVGRTFAGDPYQYINARVTFSKKINASNYLKHNNAHLVGTSILSDTGQRSKGTLRYADPYGRIATYFYTIDYTIAGPNNYMIRRVIINLYEPRNPGIEGYFIPENAISLKEMRAMSTGKLLEFARKNGDVLQPGVEGPTKRYHVLVFSMHRLKGDVVWAVAHNGRSGSSWSEGDWSVASIDATFGLNDQTSQIFRVLYGPGNLSPYHGSLFQLGAVTNQSLVGRNGPVQEVPTSSATKRMLNEYVAKVQPRLM